MNPPLSTLEPSLLIERMLEGLIDRYVFPDRAARASALLRERLAAGAYAAASGPELCERISSDLFAATSDKHLRLLWHDGADTSQDEAQLVAGLRERIRLENNGVRRVELLPGNIAQIELTIIPEAARGGSTLASAMRLVQHTNALILDLRSTLGGAQDGVAFLTSFFFPDGETHLLDVIEGPNGLTRQYWTCAYLPAPRYIDRPVYALTSSTTFSGGEAIAYSLQTLGRATVIGETTRGGAHPSEVISLAEHIELRLPVARTIDPKTGRNWEGIGVQPDIVTRAEDALRIAAEHALH
jgi:C-terminal processing protease CtpA/Prc